MTEIQLAILDEHTGHLLVDSENADIASAIATELTETLGQPNETACARPREILHPLPSVLTEPTIRISGIWHDSVIEGPGRRSVVRMQGCPIRCPGCYVPETHASDGGYMLAADTLAIALLDSHYQRDGVTILGGEPFAQPAALYWLVAALRQRQYDLHITVYTGYTIETLQHRFSPMIGSVLSTINVLIDGPYVQSLSGSAGPWTGSGNQRVHTLR